MLNSLYQYRQFIFSSIKNEFRSRFARSKLGGLWVILNPLSQVVIYTVILSNVLKAKLPNVESQYGYAIYLMAGLLGWSIFHETVSRSLAVFLENANLLKKLNFPRITLPAITVGSCLINNFLLLTCIACIFLVLGHKITLAFFWIFPLTILLAIFSIALGLICGVINVFVRDLNQIVPIILQIWFWFTPIVYPETIIPQAYKNLLHLNPLYPFIDAYHKVLVYGESPHLSALVNTGLLTLVLVGICLFIFRQAIEEMVDAI